MTLESILAAIDEQIAKLQQARSVLTDSAASTPVKGPGRPKKEAPAAPVKGTKARVMSAEARARIAAAQKKRWAAAKKASK